MADREKVLKGLEDIQKHLDTGYSFAISWKSELIRNAIVLLNEQEAVEPKVSCTEQRCGNCNKVIEMDGWKACPWCGKMIDWERWWQKNGTRNQDS